jgi:hypothetical protein
MKKLLENFKKNMDERFRGPTDDPSFSDPGHDEPEGYDELSDKVTQMVDDATNGTPVTLPGDRTLTYDDFGDGDGQYLLDGEVFANSFDEAEEQLMQMFDPRFNEEVTSSEKSTLKKMSKKLKAASKLHGDQADQIDNIVGEQEMNLQEALKEKIKQKILENLGAGETNLARDRLKGAAGAASRATSTAPAEKAIGIAAKRLQRANPQQKVDFLLSIVEKLGIEPDELQALMSKLKTSTGRAVRDAADSAGGEAAE